MTAFQTAHHALINWAQEDPDRDFLHQPVDGIVRTYTWGESADAAKRMATALLDVGLEPGDTVGILAKNCAEWFLADMAIAMAGLISVPIYPTAGPKTIAHVIEHSEAKAVFVGKLRNSAGWGPKISLPFCPWGKRWKFMNRSARTKQENG